ncbi:MAG: hypothetical protein R3B83_10630 [Nitrospirales bacterium]|nr:hypothetical protein [Nitrospira sp.]MDR4487962.1 hypothetical protein [Nitrospirales bacterium]
MTLVQIGRQNFWQNVRQYRTRKGDDYFLVAPLKDKCLLEDNQTRGLRPNLINEKAALSLEMALRLEMAFHLNMDMLLQMQAWCDSTEMRKQAGKIKIAPYVPA